MQYQKTLCFVEQSPEFVPSPPDKYRMYSTSLKQNATPVLFFRKWKRKSYSLFQCLNKEVAISVLAISYLFSIPVNSFATVIDTTEIKIQYDLDEIEVSAQRSPVVYSQVARIISVMERKEIEASPAQSVQELLGYISGVDVRQRGAEGVQADISIRGGTSDQTLILLNGINITDPQTGHHNLNLPVSLNQIERIEVLEGPAARVYGPNAFSGAINIITRQPDSKSVQAELSGGSFGLFNANLSGSFKTGKLKHLLAAGQSRSDGYIENTDFQIRNLFYSNERSVNGNRLNFQIGISDKGFGANSFYTPKYPNQYEQTNTLFSSVKWQSGDKLHLTPVIYWRRHQDRFELFRNNPPDWYATHNYHLTNSYGANLNSWFQWKFGKTSFGIEGRSENILSNVLGENLELPRPVPGENAEFTKSKSRNMASVFFEHIYYYNVLTISSGVLLSSISENNGLNFFPGLDISYQISDPLKLFTSYTTSLRMPTFTDLYYSGPTNIGNPDLVAERTVAFEAGVKLQSYFLQGHFVVFYRQGKEIIDWVKTKEDEKWQPQNLTRLNSLGTEVQVTFLLKKHFGKHFPNKIDLSYFYNELEKENLNFISNYVLDNLKHKFTGSVNMDVLANISFDLRCSFQQRDGSYTVYENNDFGNETAYESFWIWDGKLRYHKDKLTVFISANNISNTAYYDIGNISQPGRWLKAGISYQLNFD